jgi:peptidoglycan-N-acetylglucosamine deacetylase
LRTARKIGVVLLTCGVVFAASTPAFAARCPNRHALGTSRTLVVDSAEHARLGSMQYRETLPLGPREVVLTFDDGPLPPYTTRVLDVLAAECVQATFFLVGRMARNFPRIVGRIARQGHTIATHSQSHPLTFHRMSVEQARYEIEGGIASVKAALGGRAPAPFFRIPGLMRQTPVERYLASRNIMTWSADIPSDDWRRITDREIVRRTIVRLEREGRGMVLLHDIKPATAPALPLLLRELKRRGFRIVHVVPATRWRSKTATRPSQWLARRGAPKMPQVAARRSATRTAARQFPSFRPVYHAGRYDMRLREVVRRNATARVAVICRGGSSGHGGII